MNWSPATLKAWKAFQQIWSRKTTATSAFTEAREASCGAHAEVEHEGLRLPRVVDIIKNLGKGVYFTENLGNLAVVRTWGLVKLVVFH